MSRGKVANRKAKQTKISQPTDTVDEILRQWGRERPDLDPSPMGIIGRISRLDRMVEPLLTSVFRQFGLERWSFDVLAALRRSGYPYELTPTQLFSSLMLTSGAITHRIDELIKAGLVQRAPDPNDRRGVRVKLTALGLTKINDAVAAHVENEAKMLKHLSPKERSLLTALLRRLLLGLEETSAKQRRGKREGPS
jgi:DNA-binding MarR family transcriptional regulator